MFPYVIEDSIPKNMFWKVYEFMNWQEGWVLNNKTYDECCLSFSKNILWSSSPEFIEVADYLKLKVQRVVKSNLTIERVLCNGQVTNQTSMFHTDPGDLTLVLFTNSEWNAEWGGEFVCEDDRGKLHYITYKPNRSVLIPALWQHQGFPPNRMTDQLRTSLGINYKIVDNMLKS